MKFRISNIPVHVRPSFFLVSLMLSAGSIRDPLSVALWVATVFVSVLVHELGHALAFTYFGHSPSIELYQMGGVTRGTPGMATSHGRHALISLAGPAIGFLFGGLCWFVGTKLDLPPIGTKVLRDLIWVNIGWGVFNLLPIWPLDGGQALVGVLRVMSPRRGEQVGLIVSCVVTASVVIAALALGSTWSAFIAGWFGARGFVRLREIWVRGADGLLDNRLNTARLHVREGRLDDALALAGEVLATANNPLVRRDANQVVAWAHLARPDPAAALAALGDDTSDERLLGIVLARIEGREKEAIELLKRAFQTHRDPATGHELAVAMLRTGDLEGARTLVEMYRQLAEETQQAVESAWFHAGELEGARVLSELRFQRFKSASAAYNVACCEARLGQTEDAIEWLKRAIAAGWTDLDAIAKDEDLASLRTHPGFEALLVRAPTLAREV